MNTNAYAPASSATSSPPELVVARASRASKVFDSGDGVRDINLEIPVGSIFGFIGPSGSGKTTTVRLFTGVVVPTDGEVTVFDKIPHRFDTATRSRLGYMPQLSVLYPDLSVAENLRFLAALYGAGNDASAIARVLDFVELSGHEKKKVSEISGGMQRRLSLAAALIHHPDLLFLDEPTAGIDPVLRRKFWDRFTDLKEEGRTLFVTTQYVGEAAYCDYVGVLADGRLLLVDTPEGLRRAAFGGDVIDVEFSSRPDADTVEAMGRAISASASTMTSPINLRLTVEEAATALPMLGAWCNDHSVPVELAEEWVPPFDDVFVEIVEKYRNASGDAAKTDAMASQAEVETEEHELDAPLADVGGSPS